MQTTQLAGLTRDHIFADLSGSSRIGSLSSGCALTLPVEEMDLSGECEISNLQANFPNIAGFLELKSEFKGPILAVV
jgi:hypothetical protein